MSNVPRVVTDRWPQITTPLVYREIRQKYPWGGRALHESDGMDVTLKGCGHVICIRTREKGSARSPKCLLLKVPCHMCTLMRQELDAKSKVYQSANERAIIRLAPEREQRVPSPQPTTGGLPVQQRQRRLIIMAKTNKKAKSTKSDREPRFWNQTYTFKKAPKVEPAPETIGGIVYRCIQKLKTADATAITDAAVKLGIGERSGQDPRNQVLIFLRRFAADGIVSITKETGSAKAASPKAASKGRKAGKGKPKFKLAKSAASAAEASA